MRNTFNKDTEMKIEQFKQVREREREREREKDLTITQKIIYAKYSKNFKKIQN